MFYDLAKFLVGKLVRSRCRREDQLVRFHARTFTTLGRSRRQVGPAVPPCAPRSPARAGR
jgi:hypothetical protein